MYNVGSLFAGVGGICLGFKRASKNFNLVVANEIDEFAAITYENNFKHNLVKGDIRKILNPDLFLKEIMFLKKRKKNINNLILKNNFTKNDFNKINLAVKKYQKNYVEKFLFSNENFLIENISSKLTLKIESEIIENILKENTAEKLNLKVDYYKNKKELLLKNRVDILTAGFPCQAFSIAGERKGFSDHRGELFYSILDFATQLENIGHGKPRVLFLENVKNLLSHNNGKTFKIIEEEIYKAGYKKISKKIFNTNDYTGLPQNRERIFIVCFLNEADYKIFENFSGIEKINKNKSELKKEIQNALNYKMTSKTKSEFYYTKEKYPLYYNDVINLDRDINEMYEFYQLRRGMYVRKNQSGICPTLTANMGTGGHNVPLIKSKDGVRKLSPAECFDLQGFGVKTGNYILPENLNNSSLYKQSGNAVSVDMVEIIAKKIYETLAKVDSMNSSLFINTSKKKLLNLTTFRKQN
ncbi:MAG: DNA cytosine methyltransferase [Fusobacteriaceae bacterium]